jgi:hypothetical protein
MTKKELSSIIDKQISSNLEDAVYKAVVKVLREAYVQQGIIKDNDPKTEKNQKNMLKAMSIIKEQLKEAQDTNRRLEKRLSDVMTVIGNGVQSMTGKKQAQNLYERNNSSLPYSASDDLDLEKKRMAILAGLDHGTAEDEAKYAEIRSRQENMLREQYANRAGQLEGMPNMDLIMSAEEFVPPGMVGTMDEDYDINASLQEDLTMTVEQNPVMPTRSEQEAINSIVMGAESPKQINSQPRASKQGLMANKQPIQQARPQQVQQRQNIQPKFQQRQQQPIMQENYGTTEDGDVIIGYDDEGCPIVESSGMEMLHRMAQNQMRNTQVVVQSSDEAFDDMLPVINE